MLNNTTTSASTQDGVLYHKTKNNRKDDIACALTGIGSQRGELWIMKGIWDQKQSKNKKQYHATKPTSKQEHNPNFSSHTMKFSSIKNDILLLRHLSEPKPHTQYIHANRKTYICTLHSFEAFLLDWFTKKKNIKNEY